MRIKSLGYVTLLAMAVITLSLCLPLSAVYADSDPAAAASRETLPARYDLRDRGVVPPVRMQNPWGTCWAMAATEASQISVLSEKGESFEQEPIVFSPRHLAWFAGTALADGSLYPEQASEGTTIRSTSDNIHANPMENGGFSFTAANMFSSGAGPVSESAVPYRNEENMAEYDFDDSDPGVLGQNQTIQEFMAEHPGEVFTKYATLDEEGYETPARTARVEATLEMTASARLTQYASEPIFDQNGYFIPFPTEDTPEYDWSVPESRRYTREYELEEYKFLRPTTGGYAGDTFRYDETAVDAIKKEILSGRGVTASIRDDSYGVLDGRANYTNAETWSQYTVNRDEPGKIMSSNHAVCIVGWDDSWAKENCRTVTYEGDDFHEVEWEPPEDGAWIVLNSYGAEGRGFPNEGNFGYKDEQGKHTGFFYLSYYDMSLTYPASFDFDVTGHISDTIYQHDVSSVSVPHTEKFTDPAVFENIFTAEEDQKIHAISVETQDPCTQAKLTVCRLGPQDKSSMAGDKTLESEESAAAGEKLAEIEETFADAGYHRISLDKKIEIKKGERFAVTAELTTGDDGEGTVYHVPMHVDVNESSIAKYGDAVTSYIRTVINPGESYLTINGASMDWKDAVAQYKSEGEFRTDYDYDNFALKVYADDADDEEKDDGGGDQSGKDSTDGGDQSGKDSTDKGEPSGGTDSDSKADSSVSNRNTATPRTGDQQDLMLWLTALLISSMTAWMVIYHKA